MKDVLLSLMALRDGLPFVQNAESSFAQQLQQFSNEITTDIGDILATVDSTVLDITRMAYVTILLLGVFLYFTHLNKRFGRELITGGIILAILSELVFPQVFKA
jgi:hypothetical protein